MKAKVVRRGLPVTDATKEIVEHLDRCAGEDGVAAGGDLEVRWVHGGSAGEVRAVAKPVAGGLSSGVVANRAAADAAAQKLLRAGGQEVAEVVLDIATGGRAKDVHVEHVACCLR